MASSRHASAPVPSTLPPQSLPPVPRLSPALPTSSSPPTKRIHTEEDVHLWKASQAHHHLVLYVARLCEAAVGVPTQVVPDANSHPNVDAAALAPFPDPIRRILKLLDEVDSWTDDVEPEKTPQRFGNKAFRKWGERLQERSVQLHTSLLLPPCLRAWSSELSGYFSGSFGNWSRLDYGSGHELSFVAWLCVLERVGFFTSDAGVEGHEEGGDVTKSNTTDTTATDNGEIKAPTSMETTIATLVFPRYLEIVWRVQDRYGLEPAGSHGVWGLDDYQFLPYAIGAAQLRTQTDYPPSAISRPSHKPPLQHRTPRHLLLFQPTSSSRSLSSSTINSTDVPPFPNLYTTSIARIHSLKKGPFHEHSPILHDVSTTVVSWVKVQQGMLKMWDAECLGKRPVVQHFVFGRVLEWEGTERSGEEGGEEQDEGSGRLDQSNTARNGGQNTMRPTAAPWTQGGGNVGSLPPRTGMPLPNSFAGGGAAGGGGGTAAPWAVPRNSGASPPSTAFPTSASTSAARHPHPLKMGSTGYTTSMTPRRTGNGKTGSVTSSHAIPPLPRRNQGTEEEG